MIIPVQWESVISESSSKPQLIVPSPTPFCPCSNSSNKRKFLGTTTSEMESKSTYQSIELSKIMMMSMYESKYLTIMSFDKNAISAHSFAICI